MSCAAFEAQILEECNRAPQLGVFPLELLLGSIYAEFLGDLETLGTTTVWAPVPRIRKPGTLRDVL